MRQPQGRPAVPVPYNTGGLNDYDFSSLRGVAYGANGYVAVGEASNTVFTSPDGTSWTPQTTPAPNSLHRVAYGANGYVAVGDAGVMLTSPDGTSWTPQTSPTPASLDYSSLR